MRKKTKVAMWTWIVSLAVAGVAVGALMWWNPFGWAAEMAIFDSVLTGLGIASVGAVTHTAIAIEGAIKRNRAHKAELAAAEQEYRRVNPLVKGKVQSESKVKSDRLKLAKKIIYLHKNKRSGLFGLRYKPGYSTAQIQNENFYNSYNELNENALDMKATPYIKSLRQLSGRKIAEHEKKMRKSAVVSVAPQHNIVYEMSTQARADYRTLGGFNNSDTAKEFKEYIYSKESIQTRYNLTNRGDYGYITEIKFNGSKGHKTIYAGSNAESEMELYELMLLKDAMRTFEKDGGFEPIVISKSHFTSDQQVNNKKEVGPAIYIDTIDELNERIDTLTKALNGSVSKKSGYLNRRYVQAPTQEQSQER